MYRTEFWTLWEKARVRWFLREQYRNMYIIYGETDHQPRLDAWDKCLGLVHWEDPEASGGEGGGKGESGWGIHVNPWLIHVNVWQKPLQYCKVISLQLIKINGEKEKKQRHCVADKGLSSQSYGFSSSHVWMWELDRKEGWTPKNSCFWTVVLEKTLESPLDCKKIKPVNPKGNQSWIVIGRTDAEAEAPILWPPDANNWLLGKDSDVGKDWKQEEKGTTEDEVAGWYHQLGHECE